MIIYNKEGLKNVYIQDQSEEAYHSHLITESEFKNIKEKYSTGFYTPNLFVRIGYFILTLIACLCLGLLLSLLFDAAHIIDNPLWPLILGLCNYFILKFFTKNNRLFRSGIDDALLWITIGLITGSFIWAVYDRGGIGFILSGFVLLLSSYFTVRFADQLMGAVACLSLLALAFFSCIKLGNIGITIMPFVIMFFSFIIFYGTYRMEKNMQAINYRHCLEFVQFISLLTFYAAGNYFVVQKLSYQIYSSTIESNFAIPFGWFFWLWTVLMPLVYISLGIRKKNLLLLRTGLLLVIAAAYTFRFYYHLFPVELALVVSGVILLAVVFLVIKYLKFPKKGFTYADRNSKHWANNIHVESILVSSAASNIPPAHSAESSRFGGGSFGGGGSSSDF